MINGMDVLGGARYPKIVLANTPNDWFVGVFLNTFGNAWRLLEKLGQRNQAGVRVHAVWDDYHKYSPRTHDPIIKKEWERTKLFAHNYRNTKVLFSPFCENNFTTKENRKVFNALLNDEEAKTIPNLSLVNSIWKGVSHPKVDTERHGSKSVATNTKIFSYDGESAFDSDVRKCREKFASSDVFFWWCPQFNLKSKVDDKTPRDKRTEKPKAKHFETLIEYASREQRQHDVPKNWIWKPVSEKGVICVISPEQRMKPLIETKSGKIVDSFGYFGAFEGGGFRYYSGKWAIDLPQDEQLYFNNNGVRLAVDPIHRGGNYR